MPKRKAPSDLHGSSSKFGQMIGDIFAQQVIKFVTQHLAEHHPDHILLLANEGHSLIRLEMMGGTSRQMDTVITAKNSRDPIALLESKWLKDARHHNDKGAWILQLREVRKKYPTVRGAAAILAGYWTDSVNVMFRSEGGIETVLVATDEQIYASLQSPISHALYQLGLPDFVFVAKEIRKRLPRPDDLANALINISPADLAIIAGNWFKTPTSLEITSGDLIRQVIDRLVEPLPPNPKIVRFEVALHIR